MAKEELDQKTEALLAIPREEIATPYMPVDIFIKESEFQAQVAKEDREKLLAVGMDARYLDEIDVRVGALREAQSRWNKEYTEQEEAQKLWNEKSEDAYDLRDELLRDMRYAYRKDEALLDQVSNITEGYGHADMIQDLNDLAVLGKANTGPLQAINLDMSKLDSASAMANEMGELLGKANGGQLSDNEAKLLRDRAYTHLKEAIDEIRATGKYVFADNDRRLKGYSSDYLRRKNRQSSSNDADEQMTSTM